MDIRRLAAIDMFGSAGAPWRRWVILGEFLLGVIGGLALGLFLILSGGTIPVVFGVYLVTIALNYVPLSVHALTLIAPGALERELTGVDVPATLRHYTTRQFLVFVPLLFVILDLRRRRTAAH